MPDNMWCNCISEEYAKHFDTSVLQLYNDRITAYLESSCILGKSSIINRFDKNEYILFSIKFLESPMTYEGLNRYGYYVKHHSEIPGWDHAYVSKKMSVFWVKTFGIEKITNTLIFGLQKKQSYKDACTTVTKVIEELTKNNCANLAINIATKHNDGGYDLHKFQFFNPDDKGLEGLTLEEVVQTIFGKGIFCVALSIIMPPPMTLASTVEKYWDATSPPIDKWKEHVTLDWEVLEPYANSLILKLNPYNGVIVKTWLGHKKNTLKTKKMLEVGTENFHEAWYFLNHPDSGLFFARRDLKRTLSKSTHYFIRAVQLYAARTRCAQFEILTDIVSENTKPHKKKSKKKNRKAKIPLVKSFQPPLVKDTVDPTGKNLTTNPKEDVANENKRLKSMCWGCDDNTSEIKFHPCSHVCLCKNCWENYKMRYCCGNMICVKCRKNISNV